jgi:enoyl-CoA hydratase/carnithine racemase
MLPSAARRLAVGVRALSSHSATASDAPVLFVKRGRVKEIVLNRPKALNSLNLPMVRLLNERLHDVTFAPETAVIVLKGAGGKAFCAGGDIKSLWGGRGTPETLAAQEAFFREEYTLDYRLALSNQAKPHVAIYDGTVMGGGVGVSINAKFRVATEKSLFAMPETGIGLFPDVGGSYFLPRLPRHFGTFLALTGHRLKGADLVHSGVATHFMPSDKLGAMEAELCALPQMAQGEVPAAVQSVLDKFAAPLPTSSLSGHDLSVIEHACAHHTVEKIADHFSREASHSPAAAEAAKAMPRMSPTSMKVTLEQMLRGGRLSLPECYAMELRLALHFMRGHDFFEGVRALLVDKDGKPQWRPDSLAGLSRESVEAYFAPVVGVKDWQEPKL